MNYLVLFHLFPSDIVYYIYQIIKKENSANHIINCVRTKKNKNISLKIIILELFTDEIINNFKNVRLFKKPIYESIKVLYNNTFRLSRDFWTHILNMLAFKLNLIRNHLYINHLNNKNNNDYVIYKKFYSYWFGLCKKFNIKLQIIKKIKFKSQNYEHLHIASRKLDKIKSELNLFTFPLVLDDSFNQISIENSQNYLLNF